MMNKGFNYSGLFEQALRRIKIIRDPKSTRPEISDLKWKDVSNQVVFDFVDNDLNRYYHISQSANKISISCLCFIIVQLLKEYNYSIQEMSVKEDAKFSEVNLCIHEKNSNTLLIFKELEECAFWKRSDKEHKEIQNVMDSCRAEFCKYVYFVNDNAYLQVIGHNDDKDDPGRGTNIYSLKWFFESYFGDEEYKNFGKALKKYLKDVTDYIGYSVFKTLTPNSLINFRKVTENEIYKYPYEKLVDTNIKNYKLELEELEKLKDQFFNSKTFLGVLGNNDFAESLVTAEWLFDSMQKAQAIDLTVIGMGYIKAIEQLLFDLMCLHKNESRLIRKDYSYKELPKNVELNDDNIREEIIDTAIGSMAVFYRKNIDVFRNDLTWQTRKYISEAIFNYKDLRNRYFHKKNIHDWNEIVFIRNSTFELIFLLLGAKLLSEADRAQLGFPTKTQSDYDKLCEYVNYHYGGLFFLDYGEESERMVLGYYDPQSKIIDDKYVEYTGVYFKELGRNGGVIRISESMVPLRISLGKFVFKGRDEIEVTPTKVKTIFESGKFVGPSIAEEEKIEY